MTLAFRQIISPRRNAAIIFEDRRFLEACPQEVAQRDAILHYFQEDKEHFETQLVLNSAGFPHERAPAGTTTSPNPPISGQKPARTLLWGIPGKVRLDKPTTILVPGTLEAEYERFQLTEGDTQDCLAAFERELAAFGTVFFLSRNGLTRSIGFSHLASYDLAPHMLRLRMPLSPGKPDTVLLIKHGNIDEATVQALLPDLAKAGFDVLSISAANTHAEIGQAVETAMLHLHVGYGARYDTGRVSPLDSLLSGRHTTILADPADVDGKTKTLCASRPYCRIEKSLPDVLYHLESTARRLSTLREGGLSVDYETSRFETLNAADTKAMDTTMEKGLFGK